MNTQKKCKICLARHRDHVRISAVLTHARIQAIENLYHHSPGGVRYKEPMRRLILYHIKMHKNGRLISAISRKRAKNDFRGST